MQVKRFHTFDNYASGICDLLTCFNVSGDDICGNIRSSFILLFVDHGNGSNMFKMVISTDKYFWCTLCLLDFKI